jgi:hypothetical protein
MDSWRTSGLALAGAAAVGRDKARAKSRGAVTDMPFPSAQEMPRGVCRYGVDLSTRAGCASVMRVPQAFEIQHG